MCNQSEAIIILHEAFSQIKAVLGDSCVGSYLYGSYSRGDYTDESDVDILMTADLSYDDIRANFNMISHITSELSLKHNVTVSITVKPLELFKQYASSPYYHNVITEGIYYDGQ